MKCIVYPTASGVAITTPASRERDLRAASARIAEIDADIAAVQSRLTALAGSARSEAQQQDKDALASRLDQLRQARIEAVPVGDDAHIEALAAQMYPGGGFVIVDKADLPATGESSTEWTIVDGKVVLK